MTKGLSEKTEEIRAESELEIGRTSGRLLAARGKTRSPSCDQKEAGRALAAGGELQVGEEVEIQTSTSVIRLALCTPVVWKVANWWRWAAGRRRGAEINWYAHQNAELRSGASFLLPRSVRGAFARVQRLLTGTQRNR